MHIKKVGVLFFSMFLLSCHHLINATIEVRTEVAQEVAIQKKFDRKCVKSALDEVDTISSIKYLDNEQRIEDVYHYIIKGSSVDRYIGYQFVSDEKAYLVHYALFDRGLTNKELLNEKKIIRDLSAVINSKCGTNLLEFNDERSVMDKFNKYRKKGSLS